MKIPSSLKSRLKEGLVIPFVGAGVSTNVRKAGSYYSLFPSWKDLLLEAANKLDAENKNNDANVVKTLLEIDPPDYLYAADLSRKKLGSLWFDILKDVIDVIYSEIDLSSLQIPKLIWNLSPNLIITTNYDRILQWTCPNSRDLKIWNIEAPKEMVTALTKKTSPTIWHLHGSIDNVAEMILTPQEYNYLYPNTEGIEIRYKAAQQTMRNLLSTHSFLFIGYSIEKEYLGFQLEGIRNIYKNTSAPHYILVRKQEVERIKSLSLPLEIVVFEDFGEPLEVMLNELGKYSINNVQNTDVNNKKPITDDVSQRTDYPLQTTSNYLGQQTKTKKFDIAVVDSYRKMLRADQRSIYPQQLDNNAFLTKNGYMKGGYLSVAGVLLFTSCPSKILPQYLSSAATQCVIYKGTSKSSERKRSIFNGSLVDQILNSYDFISSNINKYEKPISESIQASTIYEYPMICIREVIANALVHRNYDDLERMTYIRIYENRIEIANPGRWPNKNIKNGTSYNISDLEGEPVHKNIYASHAASQVNIIEMEGSGIPSALKDCKKYEAPEPVVKENDGYLIVTIYPIKEFARNIEKISITRKLESVLDKYLEKLRDAEKSENTNDQVKILMDIGTFYYRNEQYQQAVHYLDLAISLCDKETVNYLKDILIYRYKANAFISRD